MRMPQHKHPRQDSLPLYISTQRPSSAQRSSASDVSNAEPKPPPFSHYMRVLLAEALEFLK